MTSSLRAEVTVNGRPFAGADAAPQTFDRAIIVNGEQIDPKAIAAEVQNHSAERGKPAQAWRKAANALVVRILLLQEARSRGIDAGRQEVGPGRFETDEDALIRSVLDQAVDVAPPSTDAVHAEWKKDPSRFRTPPLWEVSHILCACDPREVAGRTKALERANGILEQALCDPKGFGSFATRESDCDSRSSGGALGQLGPGDTVPEFEAALRDLAEGEITPEPVLTRHGYHVIRLDAYAEGQVLPFEAVREKVATALEKTAWAKEARQFVNRLVDAACIEGADLNIV